MRFTRRDRNGPNAATARRSYRFHGAGGACLNGLASRRRSLSSAGVVEGGRGVFAPPTSSQTPSYAVLHELRQPAQVRNPFFVRHHGAGE
eukprot:608571-Pleurochrysis_carterae.AAC.4